MLLMPNWLPLSLRRPPNLLLLLFGPLAASLASLVPVLPVFVVNKTTATRVEDEVSLEEARTETATASDALDRLRPSRRGLSAAAAPPAASPGPGRAAAPPQPLR